jgi:hypothetical protein
MIETMTARQCIGCGRLEAQQTCVGICNDAKVELVYAEEYQALEKELTAARAQISALAAQMREIVNTEPRNEQWQQCYRALQERARRALTLVGAAKA